MSSEDIRLINLLVNNINLFIRSKSLIKSNYFEDEYARVLYLTLSSFYDEFSRLPNSTLEFETYYHPKAKSYVLVDEEKLIKIMNEEVYQISNVDSSLALRTIANFISTNQSYEMISRVRSAITSNRDQSDIDSKIKSIVDDYVASKDYDLASSNRELVSLSDIDHASQLISSKASPSSVIKSSIISINRSLQYKGYVPSDVVMVVAPPGVGKSTFLLTEGANAAEQGYRVLHVFIGDMDEADGSLKYFSNIMNTSQDMLLSMTHPDRSEFIKSRAMTNAFSLIDIKVYEPDSINANQLYDQVLKIQAAKRVHYDMIIVDYPENLESLNMDSMYLSGDRTYKVLNKLAKANNCVVLTGSQPKSYYWNHEVIPLDSAAESSKKQHHVDYVITIGAPTIAGDSVVMKMNLAKARRGSRLVCSVKLLGSMSKIVEITDNEYSNIKNSVVQSSNYSK